MKKRILSVLLTALMLISLFPVSLAFAGTLGDVDENGTLTAADARLALRASVGLENLTPAQITAADADFSGDITAADARLILRASVGLETLHTHSYTEAITKNATCTEKGTKTFTCECGDTYTEDIAPSGHKAVTDKAVASTCTKAGKTEGSHCSVCNKVLTAQENVPAKGHTPKLDSSTVIKVTCKENGYTGDTKCTVCGIVTKKGTVIEAKGTEHIWQTAISPAGCTQDGYSVQQCSVCDYIDESTYKAGEKAKGHSWGEWTEVKATCTEEGYKIRTCSVCAADEKTEVVEAKGHTYSYRTTKRANCKETGERTGTCSECRATTTEVLPLTPCNLQATNLLTEKVHGSKETSTPCKLRISCRTCGNVVSENTSDAAHTVGAENITTVQTQSCTDAWVVNHTCQYCDYEKNNVIAAAPQGHLATLDQDKTSQPTCTDDGVYVYSGTCTREGCGEHLDNAEVIIPARGHSLSGTQTCTTAVICTDCNKVIDPALGHDYTMNASVYDKEISTFFCQRCGEETDNQLEVFNSIANSLKTPSYYSGGSTMNYIDKTSVDTSYTRFDFGIYTSAIRGLYEDEMANTPDDYSPIRRQHVLYALPLAIEQGEAHMVSALEESDIDSIKVERISGLKFAEALKDYNPQYTNESQAERFNTLKGKTVSSPVIKVTVNVKNENYHSVKNLPENVDTSLQKIYDFDIRADAKDFDVDKNGNLTMTEVDKGDGYEISMTMTLNDIASDAVVTYYFDAETYEPIIALYDADITMKQTIDMNFRIGIFSLNGELDPLITTKYTRAYIFPDYAV